MGQPELDFKDRFKHFVAQRKDQYYSVYEFIVTKCPTLEELEDFLCDVVPQIRIVRFKLDMASYDTPPEWHQEFLEIAVELASKYRPWQWGWCCQESGAFELDWVEVDKWYYKYKDKVGFVQGGVVDDTQAKP